MSDNKPKYLVKQVNPNGEWNMAEAFTHDDAVMIGNALADWAKRHRFRFPTFEVEAPDGQKRRFGSDKA